MLPGLLFRLTSSQKKEREHRRTPTPPFGWQVKRSYYSLVPKRIFPSALNAVHRGSGIKTEGVLAFYPSTLQA